AAGLRQGPAAHAAAPDRDQPVPVGRHPGRARRARVAAPPTAWRHGGEHLCRAEQASENGEDRRAVPESQWGRRATEAYAPLAARLPGNRAASSGAAPNTVVLGCG